MKRRWLFLLLLPVFAVAMFLTQLRDDLPLEELKQHYAPPPSAFIHLQGMDVHVRQEGSGPPLLLIHGTAASLHTFDAWTRDLAPHFRVIRMDLPGFGLTGPNPSRDYSMGAYVAFVTSLMDALEIPRAHVAGNSLGGGIAWGLAAASPQRVDHLILLDASGYPRKGSPPLVFGLARLPLVPSLLVALDPSRLVEKSLREVYADPSLITPETLERYRDLALRPGNRQAFVDRATLGFENRSALISHIQAPTLVLWGEEDAWIPVSDAARFCQDIQGARCITYPHVGHLPMEEAAQRSASDVLAFLSR